MLPKTILARFFADKRRPELNQHKGVTFFNSRLLVFICGLVERNIYGLLSNNQGGRHYVIYYGELLFFLFGEQTSLLKILTAHTMARPGHCL
jgi:hypothetical protein